MNGPAAFGVCTFAQRGGSQARAHGVLHEAHTVFRRLAHAEGEDVLARPATRSTRHSLLDSKIIMRFG